MMKSCLVFLFWLLFFPMIFIIAYKVGFFDLMKPVFMLVIDLSKTVLSALIDLLTGNFSFPNPNTIYENFT